MRPAAAPTSPCALATSPHGLSSWEPWWGRQQRSMACYRNRSVVSNMSQGVGDFLDSHLTLLF